MPPVVVETQQSAPKAKQKANKKPSTAASSIPATQPTPEPQQPTGPGNSSASDKTAYGPVQDYVAKNTATGIKTDTPLKEIPQSVSVVGTEQMRDQGVQTLQDALRYVPGVVADSHGLDSRADGSFIRGTAAAEYLDGLRRNFNTFYYGYRVDPYFMERVEVLRGPASVLYGQAPVGGIINSVSKRPQGETGGEIGVEYGTFDFKQVKFDTTGLITSDGKWSYRVTGLARDSDTQVDYVEDDRYAIQPAITWRPDSSTSVTLLGHFQKDRTGSTQQFFPHIGTVYPNVNGRRIAQDRFAGEPGDYYDTDVASGSLMIEHSFNEVFKLQHVSRYADIQNKYDSVLPTNLYLGSFPLRDGYLDGNNTFPNFSGVITQEKVARYRSLSDTHTQVFNQDTNLEAKFATGALSHRVLGGIDYAHFEASHANATRLLFEESFNVYDPQYGYQGAWVGYNCSNGLVIESSRDDLEACDVSDQTVTQTGIYIQDQMRLGNWIAVLGARKDWVENVTDTPFNGKAIQKDDAATYRAGLMYEFAFGLTPYVSYSESFVPNVGTSSPARGAQSFDPQEGRMYEVGFKYQPAGANFAINGAIFDISESSRLVTDPNNINYQLQIGSVSIKGFEIEAVGQVTKNLKVMGGYSYTDAQYDDGTTLLNNMRVSFDAGGNQIESIPKHLASLWGLWEFDQPELKGWSVGGGVRYIGESWDGTNTVEVPSVTLFDAMIAYETEDWRWQVTGRNLEDKDYVSTCLARGDCFLGSARTIVTGFTYKY